MGQALTNEQRRVLFKALRSPAFQNLIGAEEWNLTEAEEETLWVIINLVDDD